MSKVGKEAKCSRCGQVKIIEYGKYDTLEQRCKEFYEFDYEPINCDLCGLEVKRKDLAQHKLDMHKKN